MSALALMGIQRGMQAGQGIGDAFRAQAAAEIQAMNLERQIAEIEGRNKLALQEIYKQGDEVAAEQIGAFISGGVELTGSAMSVVSDTLNNAAKSAFMRQREVDYTLGSLEMEKKQFERAASTTNLLLNMGTAVMGAGTNFAGDYYENERNSLRERGAAKPQKKEQQKAQGLE